MYRSNFFYLLSIFVRSSGIVVIVSSNSARRLKKGGSLRGKKKARKVWKKKLLYFIISKLFYHLKIITRRDFIFRGLLSNSRRRFRGYFSVSSPGTVGEKCHVIITGNVVIQAGGIGGALGLIFASATSTCNELNPLIEPPQECFCRKHSSLHRRGLQYAGNRGQAALATGKRMPHASGQHASQISISPVNEKSHRASMLVTGVRATALCTPCSFYLRIYINVIENIPQKFRCLVRFFFRFFSAKCF